MNSQVKLFFVFLAVLAVVSVFSFFDILGGVRSAQLHNPVKSLLPIADDADQDGLSDQDESYWNTDFQNPDTDNDGFLDGEEISSGFDPREPSSDPLGDKLLDTVFGSVKTVDTSGYDESNLTENTMGMLAAGIAAGDLKKDADPAKKDTALAILTSSTIDSFYNSLPVYDPQILNVVEDTENNQIKYLESLAQIIKTDLLDSVQKPDLNQNPFIQTDFFQNKADQFSISLTKTTSLDVPKNWVDTHKTILTLLNKFHHTYKAVANYENDSVKAVVAFNDINDLNLQTKNILEEVKTKIQANGLQPKDIVFQIMESVY